MLNPKDCQNGQEQFKSWERNRKTYIQYDYRDIDGELFSTVKGSIKECRQARNEWLSKKQVKHTLNCL